MPLPFAPRKKIPFVPLLGIPLLVYLGWLAEIFFLEGSLSLFLSPEPLPLLLYTLAGCIMTGIFFPLLILRRSFLSGAVNMFQIGFRSKKRTAAILGAGLVFLVIPVVLLLPPGPARPAFLSYFLLYLPTGVAAIMVCWVLLGTHIQALVRHGGVVLSIMTGMVTTAVLFAVSSVVHTPVPGIHDPVPAALVLGVVTAFVFFAARDVYVAVLAVTSGMSFLSVGTTATVVPAGTGLPVILAAIITLAALCGAHWYLFHTYITVEMKPGL